MEQTHPFPQPPQNPHLHQSLLMKPLLIPNNLHRHDASLLMIHTPHHLAKTALTQQIHHFIPIRQMISKHDVIIPALVVVAVIPLLLLLRLPTTPIFPHVGDRRGSRPPTIPRPQRRGAPQTPDDLPRAPCARKKHAFPFILHHLAPLENIQPRAIEPFVQVLFRGQRGAGSRARAQSLGFFGGGVDVAAFLGEVVHFGVGGEVEGVFG